MLHPTYDISIVAQPTAVSVIVCLPLLCICISGCGGGDELLPEPELPQSTVSDGVTWKLMGEPTPQESAMIDRALAVNSGFVDYEELDGTLVRYTNPQNHNRFVWVLTKPDETKWFYMEFQGDSLTGTGEGTGLPFGDRN